jgi:hypothetical protein
MAFGDRSAPLRANPGKQREFERRGRESSAKTLGARKTPLKRQRRRRPPEGPLTRQEWEAEVYRLDGGLDIVTGELVRVPRPSNFHHVVPKQTLRRAGLHHVVFDPDNGVTVADRTHSNHENAHRRIPREALPERALAFARRHGFMDYIEKTYPTRGGPDGGR